MNIQNGVEKLESLGFECLEVQEEENKVIEKFGKKSCNYVICFDCFDDKKIIENIMIMNK